MTGIPFWRSPSGARVSSPQRFFSDFPKSILLMIEYRIKDFCGFYEIERKSVVRGVDYWLPVDIYGGLPVDIYGGLLVVSEHSCVYGNPKMPIFNNLADAVNVIDSIKKGIKYHYFQV